MVSLKSILNFLKGAFHAKGTEQCIPRGSQPQSRIVYPVEALYKQALSDFSGIRVLARACADERGRALGTLPKDSIRQESRILIAAAKAAGCFLNLADIPGTRYTVRTGESEVRLVQKDQLYYKIKDPFAKLHLKKHPPEYVLFEHVIHNVLFPDCRLEFLGVTEDYHEARLVYRQQAVRSDRRPTDSQIADSLLALGLKPEGRYAFGNANLFVTDVGQDGDNVLLDDDEHLRFIDPIIGFKEPIQKVLVVPEIFREWVEHFILTIREK